MALCLWVPRSSLCLCVGMLLLKSMNKNQSRTEAQTSPGTVTRGWEASSWGPGTQALPVSKASAAIRIWS